MGGHRRLVTIGRRPIRKCVDCHQPLATREKVYIVRGSIWAEAGMGSWDAGYLHIACLEKRLGRKLAVNDYLIRPVGQGLEGVEVEYHPDYLTSPECLQHGDNPLNSSPIASALRRHLGAESVEIQPPVVKVHYEDRVELYCMTPQMEQQLRDSAEGRPGAIPEGVLTLLPYRERTSEGEEE